MGPGLRSPHRVKEAPEKKLGTKFYDRFSETP